MTEWGLRYNCDCVIYDSVTGRLLPGNLTAYSDVDVGEREVWYTDSLPLEYEVCLFTLPRGECSLC